MTDPVDGIRGTQGTHSGGSYSGGFPGDHKKRGAPAPQSDLVEISRDARKRLAGGKKKSLLEYLKELFGQ